MPRAPKKQNVHIPRPANCFMIFRADWLRRSIANSTPGSRGPQKQKDVSQEAAVAWNNLSPALRQLYKVQADILKDEHKKKYPGWVYQPKVTKKRAAVVDEVPLDGSSTKRVARGRTSASHQKPSDDVKAKWEAVATPFTQIDAPRELVWDRSWFSGTSSMRDPFYSAPLQPIASVSSSSATYDVKVAHFIKESSTAPPVVSTLPHSPPSPAQMHGFGMAPNFHAIPEFVYHHNLGLDDLERLGHSILTPASNTLGLPDFHTLPQESTPVEPPVSPGPQIVPSNTTEDSIPTPGSVGEVLTPKSEAEPPTQALAKSSDLTYDELLESFYNNNDWGIDPTFNSDFDPFSLMGL